MIEQTQIPTQIPYEHWSLRVGRPKAFSTNREVEPFFGEIVTDIDDVDQSIGNLILTPRGSVPTEPEKGWDMFEIIDRHPTDAIPFLVQSIGDLLTIWEPRIVVQNVEVSQLAFEHFKTSVFWHPVESVLSDIRRTEVRFGTSAGLLS